MEANALSNGSRKAWYARRLAVALAWTIVALCLALVLLAVIIAIRNRFDEANEEYFYPLLLLNPVVGALIVTRRPGNAIGWLLCALGFAFCTWAAINAYVSAWEWSFDWSVADPAVPQQLPPGWPWIAWFGTGILPPAIGATLTFGLLLFPDGRLPSPRWRPVAWLAGCLVVGLAVEEAFGREVVVEGPRFIDFSNPARIEAVGSLIDSTEVVGRGLGLLIILAAVASVLDRARRARGVERQQLKWFALIGSLVGLVTVVTVVAVELRLENLAWYGFSLGILLGTIVGIPAAVGVAILRYRLYEVDRLINRTLVYGLLTLALGLFYVAAVLMLRGALHPLTGSSDLAVAGSTLAVAALFYPARDRVQRAVDRRFYRRKYDAQRTVELFAARLRNEVDLDALAADLTAVVRETVQPAHVGLWLREAPGRAIAAAETGRGPSRG